MSEVASGCNGGLRRLYRLSSNCWRSADSKVVVTSRAGQTIAVGEEMVDARRLSEKGDGDGDVLEGGWK